MHARRLIAGAALAAAPWVTISLGAQEATTLPRKLSPRPTGAAIRAADLMTRLYQFADDSMGGRAAGTEGQLKATDYLAAEAARLGLKPGGEEGGYFQTLPLLLRGFVAGGSVSASRSGKRFVLGEDFGSTSARNGVVRLPAEAVVVFGGEFGDTASYIHPADAAGRIVVLRPSSRSLQLSTRGLAVQPGSHYSGAAAIVIPLWDRLSAPMRRSLSQPGLVMRTAAGQPLPPTLVTSVEMAEALLEGTLERGVAAPAATAQLDLTFAESPAAARNVIAILPGSDPALRGQFVALGSHSDHDPVAMRAVDHDSVRARGTPWQRLADSLAPPRLDSIRNGADDDGSGVVAMLEIAEALATAPERPRRSVLFVWHSAEELGLLGASWFTEHPTVPRDSIVAQFNLDMVGRGGAADIAGGGPDYVQLIGSRRLSTGLGDLVEALNAKRPDPFKFDYTFDANGHKENLYCRSDHAMYARHGIPVVFFTTGLHRDYHQVTDEPQYIAYHKLERLTGFVRDVVVTVANKPWRPKVDRPRADPAAACRQ